MATSSDVDPNDLSDNVDIFWLLFGAVLVFCEFCEAPFHTVELSLARGENMYPKRYSSTQ